MDFSYNLINRDNLATLSLAIRHIISRGAHIAIDLEFTGLGESKGTRAQNIEERYLALREVVVSHAVVSFGLSVFEKIHETFLVHNFTFLMLCRKPYTVSPSSLSFLVDNGFDFNDQIMNGIPYTPGNDDPTLPLNDPSNLMRSLFLALVRAESPLVVHNGLLDLMFLYQAFYAELPSNLSSFVADLSDLFPSRLYDTKFMADYVARERASFLSYLFTKYERLNRASKQVVWEICQPIQFKPSTMPLVDLRLGLPQKQRPSEEAGKPFCEEYAHHGACRNGKSCLKSHDLDLILDHEEGKVTKKRKLELESRLEPIHSGLETYHSAAYDAFMTGLIFSHQHLNHESESDPSHGKVYLMFKTMPLNIVKSNFASYSKAHLAKRTP